MRGTQYKTAGYSLIEVLIAFAIMMMVLAVLLPAQAKLLASSVSRHERQMANEYALSRLAAVGITHPLVAGADTGIYQDKWIWTETISPNPLSTIDYPLFDVLIVISTLGEASLAEIAIIRVGE